VLKAAKKMTQNEYIIDKWSPMLLRMNLNNLLWRDSDSIEIKRLWDYLCTYCYLPRLANYDVLEGAVRDGLNSKEYFAFAAGFENGRYIELKYGDGASIDRSGLLVKPEAAEKQFEEDEEKAAKRKVKDSAITGGGENISSVIKINGSITPSSEDIAVLAPPMPQNTLFRMSAPLDVTRIGRDVQRLVDEVIHHLSSVDGCRIEISLEVNANVPDGLSHETVRTVSENCRTLKVDNFEFMG